MSDEIPLSGGRFSHLFLFARDHATMVAFYRDTLGMTLHEHADGEYAFLSLPGSALRLAIYPGRHERPASIENHWFLVIDVDDVRRAAARLAERGVDVGEVFDVPYGRAATFADPEGNVIEIHQPGD